MQNSNCTALQMILENIGAYSKLEVNTFSTANWTIKRKLDCVEVKQQIHQGSPFKTAGRFSLGY